MSDTAASAAGIVPAQYRVTGMDCTSCAGKIETAAIRVAGVTHVKVSIASQIMTVVADDPARALPDVEKAVTALGYQLDRVESPRPIHVAAAYKRALWIVVALNLGYGVAEVIGSVIAGSQAVQADALDFLGDGIISWLGLVAIGWSLGARAKAALLQGVFLGALGLAVVGGTIYRVLVTHQPEHVMMGGLAVGALVVNVIAAAVLLPHRHGDANARAVWLFSRNDAIGNLAVVIAAALVWWTASPWPDLVVAFAVAGLFLQSSWSIVRDARSEIRMSPASAEPRGHGPPA